MVAVLRAKALAKSIVECSFTPKHYLETLSSFLDSDYIITPVGDFFQNRIHDKHILLRHDVDLSLDYALDMALLEKDNDIHATYYILLHSDLYDAMSPYGIEKIRAIRDAGHSIGLHLDTRYFMGSIEFEILSQLSETSVVDWSRHLNTLTPDVPAYLIKSRYGDVNTTIAVGYRYIADSGMAWRNGCACKQKDDKIHLLIHPEWTMVTKHDRFEILEQINQQTNHNKGKAFNQFREILKERVIEIETITGNLPVSRNTSIS